MSFALFPGSIKTGPLKDDGFNFLDNRGLHHLLDTMDASEKDYEKELDKVPNTPIYNVLADIAEKVRVLQTRAIPGDDEDHDPFRDNSEKYEIVQTIFSELDSIETRLKNIEVNNGVGPISVAADFLMNANVLLVEDDMLWMSRRRNYVLGFLRINKWQTYNRDRPHLSRTFPMVLIQQIYVLPKKVKIPIHVGVTDISLSEWQTLEDTAIMEDINMIEGPFEAPGFNAVLEHKHPLTSDDTIVTIRVVPRTPDIALVLTSGIQGAMFNITGKLITVIGNVIGFDVSEWWDEAAEGLSDWSRIGDKLREADGPKLPPVGNFKLGRVIEMEDTIRLVVGRYENWYGRVETSNGEIVEIDKPVESEYTTNRLGWIPNIEYVLGGQYVTARVTHRIKATHVPFVGSEFAKHFHEDDVTPEGRLRYHVRGGLADPHGDQTIELKDGSSNDNANVIFLNRRPWAFYDQDTGIWSNRTGILQQPEIASSHAHSNLQL